MKIIHERNNGSSIHSSENSGPSKEERTISQEPESNEEGEKTLVSPKEPQRNVNTKNGDGDSVGVQQAKSHK